MKKCYCFLLANLFALSLFATHNKAGEIQYRQIGERTIQCSIITFTDPVSTQSDRDSLEIFWGDGTSEWVLRSNGLGSPPQGILSNPRNKQNIYTAEHTYTDFGEYTLVMEDRNRNAGIINANAPNSDQVPFHISNTFLLLSGETNSSPRTLFPPVDMASVFTPFEHLATAYDEDGDSLSYRLITPKGADGEDIPLYIQANLLNPSADNQLSLDPLTGHLVWDTPQVIGTYVIGIEITSFRNGLQNGSFIRDMLIEVGDNPNPNPTIAQEALPVFGSIQEVSIGDTIELSLPAFGFNVSLLEGGGLFEQPIQPSTFSVLATTNIFGIFSWIVDESHVRDQPYDTAFKISSDQNTAGFYLIRYKVNGINTSTSYIAENDHDIVIYPNPSSDYIAIRNDSKDLSHYEIYSITGQLNMSGKLTSDRLDIQSLTIGSYVLLLDGRYSVKFSKVGR